jgi:protein-S-isoprenylcysteine O-methyltransferase Ste14
MPGSSWRLEPGTPAPAPATRSPRPYRYVRHPGYAGALLSLLGLALTLWNWAGAAVMVIGSLLACIWRVMAEEAVLEASLEGFDEFERTRPRLFPGLW